MPKIQCQECAKKFYVKPNRLERGWGKYCSNKCKHVGQRTGRVFPCSYCHKPSYKNKKDQKRSQSGKFFCGKSCQTKWRNSELYIGSSHANWKGGESSYRSILKRADIELICAKCETDDNRVLAVHHKDKNRQNNDISNLLWLCHNCHYLVHHFDNEAKSFVLVSGH